MTTWRSERVNKSATGGSPRRSVPVFSDGVRQEQGNLPAGKLRAGDLCPQCKQKRLDYDGLLNLSCPNCGYAVGGCFT